MTDELDPAEIAQLRSALQHRAGGAPVRPAGVAEVRRRGVLRRRRQMAVVLGGASLAVLGGLVVANLNRPASSEAEATASKPSAVSTTTVPSAVPPPDAIPLPTIGAYPRDPAMGPQPVKVSYTVREGDTFESIAAAVGADPADIRTQTGGSFVVGQVLSLLVAAPDTSLPSTPTTVPVVLAGG